MIMHTNDQQVAEFTYATICRILRNHFLSEEFFARVVESISAAIATLESVSARYYVNLQRVKVVELPHIFSEGAEVTVSCHFFTVCFLKKVGEVWDCREQNEIISWVYKISSPLSILDPADAEFLKNKGLLL